MRMVCGANNLDEITTYFENRHACDVLRKRSYSQNRSSETRNISLLDKFELG